MQDIYIFFNILYILRKEKIQNEREREREYKREFKAKEKKKSGQSLNKRQNYNRKSSEVENIKKQA